MNPSKKRPVVKKSWDEFQSSKMLWLANRTLHIFGWCIVIAKDENGEVTEVYPARTKFRGFSESANAEGYAKLSEYMKDNADNLIEESKREY